MPRLVTRTPLCLLPLLLAPVLAGAAGPRLEDSAAEALHDLQAAVTITRLDAPALEQVSRDLVTLFRMKNVTVRFREPGKFRAENRIGLFIANGPTIYYRVPALGLKRREDLGAAQSRRYGLVDVGVITKRFLEAVNATYLRAETAGDVQLAVFDVRGKTDAGARCTLWVDPVRRILARREPLDATGKPRGTFLYQEPREISPGIWLPTRVEIRTAAGTVGAVVEYTDIRANTDIPDALFAIP